MEVSTQTNESSLQGDVKRPVFTRFWSQRSNTPSKRVGSFKYPEGFERGNDKEFAHFLAIAKGSTGEVRAQLYVALDQGYLPLEKFEQLTNIVIEIGELLSGFIRYLKQAQLRGNLYR